MPRVPFGVRRLDAAFNSEHQGTHEPARFMRRRLIRRHGRWIPISAKILKGKRVTGSLGIKDDLENAGGIWVNEPVVVNGNLISSRTPKDLTPFAKAMVDYLIAQK